MSVFPYIREDKVMEQAWEYEIYGKVVRDAFPVLAALIRAVFVQEIILGVLCKALDWE